MCVLQHRAKGGKAFGGESTPRDHLRGGKLSHWPELQRGYIHYFTNKNWQ